MSYTGRKHQDFDYNTKLLGILPYNFVHMTDGPWDTRNLRVCKKPSQYSLGQLDVAGHRTLVGSAIVERRFGLENEWLNSSSEDTGWPKAGLIEAFKDVTYSKQLPRQEGEKIDSGATRFVRNCFNPKKDSIPDFICERHALIFLATEESSYVLKARKCRFTSPVDSEKDEYEAIELQFFDLTLDPMPMFRYTGDAFGGSQFVPRASKDDGLISASMKTKTVAKNSTITEQSEPSCASQEENGDEDSNSGTYHYAFVQGELTKCGSQSPNRKFNFILRYLVDGVWNLEENPEDYTCGHLAEIRTANENTVQSRQGRQSVYSNSFYKRVRMQRNWFQAHLAGEKNYLVGISDAKLERNRCVKELWLFDVDRIPRAVSIAAEEERFQPWTPEKLHHKLFSALEFINETMMDAKPDEEFTFIHCDDSDYIYCDRDGSLLNEYVDSKNKVTIQGLPRPPSVLDDAEQKTFDENQLITILQCVGYVPGEPLPLLQRIQGDAVEVTFIHSKLAEAFFKLVKTYWRRKVKKPAGFEKLRIEKNKLDEPSDFKGQRKSLNLNPPNRFSYDHSSHSNSGYGGRPAFDLQRVQQSSSTFGRQPHYTSRTKTFSDTVDNWRK